MKNKLKLVLTLLLVYVVYYNSNNSQKCQFKRDTSIYEIKKNGRKCSDGGLSKGIEWGDYYNDGDPDLYLTNSNVQRNASHRPYLKGRFKKITAVKDSTSKTVVPQL